MVDAPIIHATPSPGKKKRGTRGPPGPETDYPGPEPAHRFPFRRPPEGDPLPSQLSVGFSQFAQTSAWPVQTTAASRPLSFPFGTH